MSDELREKALQRLREDPVFFARVVLKWIPFDYQEELLQTKAKRIAAVWGRQTGKSSTIAVKTVHFAVMNPGVIVLIVSPGIRQSMLMFSKIADFFLSNKLLRATVSNYTKTEIILNNRSRIIALPCSQDGATLRGYTADLVIMDEAAFMPETVISNVIFPMLATTEQSRGTGIAILISTPWGRNHIFYRCTTNPRYWSKRITSDKCPLITKQFLEDQRREIGDIRYRIEYEAEFVEDATALFSQDMLRGIIEYKFYERRVKRNMPELLTDAEVLTNDGDLKNGAYVMGLDLGKRRDYSVLSVFKKASRRVALEPQDEFTLTEQTTNVSTQTIDPAWLLVYQKVFPAKSPYTTVVIPHTVQVYNKFNVIGGFIDQTGVGEAPVEEIRRQCNALQGIILHTAAKHAVMMWYYTYVERRRVGIPDDKNIITEHVEQNFGYSTKNVKTIEALNETEGVLRFWHPEGRNDDRLWSIALAIYALAGEGATWKTL